MLNIKIKIINKVIECANKYDIDIHASGPLGQGKAANYDDIEKYLNYLISESNCNSYFIGTKIVEHLKDNIKITKKILGK